MSSGPSRGPTHATAPSGRHLSSKRVERRAPAVYAGRHQPQTAACGAAGRRIGLEEVCIARKATCRLLAKSIPAACARSVAVAAGREPQDPLEVAREVALVGEPDLRGHLGRQEARAEQRLRTPDPLLD